MPVYMIRQGERGPVKIGVAKDVVRRLETMQTGNHERLTLLRTFEGDTAEERRLHRQFADHRLSGEWFSFTKAMLGDVGLVEVTHQEPPLPDDPEPVAPKPLEPWEERLKGFAVGFEHGIRMGRIPDEPLEAA